MTPHFPTIILLELLVVLVDIAGSSASEAGLDTQSSGTAGTNIRRLMVDLNMPLEGSVDESNSDTNYFTHGQPALTQPAVTERYDHPGHFTTLNLGAMRPDNSYLQRGPDDDPKSEFEVGQQFDNKEAVLIAIKTYSIRRAVEYKILKSDQLKYSVQCTQFGTGCQWRIRVSYR
ncbi:hypothetical protein PIB30_064201 [Stylosanthes scabra]|uniref:Transposase MuDR plant domain-containing protein n=1 Tax=Stylosanthes scabra TaxID=79078 RepID=A0ABU6VPV8_9FABA|nr:hypothetical protein [Stylosanthes scabra]